MKHIHTKDVKTCNIRASQAIAIHNEAATQSVAGRRTSLLRRGETRRGDRQRQTRNSRTQNTSGRRRHNRRRSLTA